jgi:hypothetical protein
MMKLVALAILLTILSACYADKSRPSDNEIMRALADSVRNKGAPAQVGDVLRHRFPDHVGCTLDDRPTCRFKVGAIPHVAVFAKDAAGAWVAISVDEQKPPTAAD